MQAQPFIDASAHICVCVHHVYVCVCAQHACVSLWMHINVHLWTLLFTDHEWLEKRLKPFPFDSTVRMGAMNSVCSCLVSNRTLPWSLTRDACVTQRTAWCATSRAAWLSSLPGSPSLCRSPTTSRVPSPASSMWVLFFSFCIFLSLLSSSFSASYSFLVWLHTSGWDVYFLCVCVLSMSLLLSNFLDGRNCE